MAHEIEPIAEYVRKVNDETRRFAQALLAENERLRNSIPALQQERDRAAADACRARAELDRQARERSQLEGQIAKAEAESDRFSAHYLELEQQNFNLLNLYVASYRLHGTLDLQEVLATVREIIANLIGCEEMAVFRKDPGKRVLRLVASMGVDAATMEMVSLGSGIIGTVGQTGRTFIAGDAALARSAHADAGLTACLPLKIDGAVTGVIAIFRLLEQKQELEEIDRELLNLLGTHAAMALYATELHARFGRTAATGAAARG